jgi:hypothetical protein
MQCVLWNDTAPPQRWRRSVSLKDRPQIFGPTLGCFGGSVLARRLAGKGYRVGVLERGRRYRDEGRGAGHQ